MRLTNTTRETIDLIVKGEAKDGVPPTESLAPGETRAIASVVDNAQFRGRVATGVLVIEAPAARAAKD